MKVLLLAAGRSRRAKPIEDKNFLKFHGKMLIEHQLEALKKAGFDDVIIVGGAHNLAKLQEVADEHGASVVEQKNLDEGMAGAVLSVEAIVTDEPLFIVSSNDVVEAGAYEQMLEAINSSADAYLLGYEVDEYFPGGYIQLDGERITDIVEKPGEGNEPSRLINLVLHMYKDPKMLYEALKTADSTQDDVYEVALDALMKEKLFEVVRYSAYWQAVKFPWHVLDLMNHFFETFEGDIDPSAQIADSATIKGKVILAEGVKVFDGASIQGPAYIGKNTVVASNALVRGSIIGDDCVVGYSTEIARSFVGDKCWFHSNYVGDAVLGDNCSFGAGAILANLRLDEKEIKGSKRNKLGPLLGNDIRVGVNTSLMPGIRIGSNTMITSGLTISEDIAAGKFVNGKTELTITENRFDVSGINRDELKGKL